MRVLVVDDEPPARDRLRRLLSEMTGWELVAEAGNGQQALQMTSEHEPDIVLMDIRMPGMDGVEAARHLAELEDPPAVIFTTAFNEYAIEAFKAQAVGYLMKPIRRERLADALSQATRLTRPQLARVAEQSRAPRRGHICARLRGELRLIPIEDIFYFRAEQKYITVRHQGGEDVIEESLKRLEEEFAPDFQRIHRNAMIAMHYLESLEKDDQGQYQARLSGCDERLSVSRRHASELRKRMRSK